MKWYFLLIYFIVSTASKGQDAVPSAVNSARIHFVPTSFSNSFSLNIIPVLTIKPGDTISTETIDAAGFDKSSVKRQKGGNPLTGPFYVENSRAGDVLAITLTRVVLNRSDAFTTESFSSRSLPKAIIKNLPKIRKARWHLDLQNGFASPDSGYEHLYQFKVPLHPFLGCIGVAPSSRKNEVLSFFQGTYGGNLDFSGIAQSATIYLPVFHDGAFLYIGDGHAVQGDGELAGNALETSLDVDFTVKLIKGDTSNFVYPRVEDSIYIMSIGIDKKLDNALKIATSGLLDWLQADYLLSLTEASQVMSTSIEYTIAEIADPEVEVVAKIKKEIIKVLKKYN